MEKFISGVIPSPVDSRDYKLSTIAKLGTSFPAKYIQEYNHPVKNQGAVGSCVVHTISECSESFEEEQTGKYTEFSTGWLYGYRPYGNNQGVGLIPRDTLQAWLKFGNATKEMFPFYSEVPDIIDIVNKQKGYVLPGCYPYRISAYARIYDDQEYKTAISKGLKVMFVLPVWESFYQTESDGRVPMPNRYNESFLGYHAVRAMGWNWESEHYDAFLNSWGPEWGDKGYGYILDGYPIQEMWVITDDIVPHKLTWLDKADEWMRGVWYRLRGLI